MRCAWESLLGVLPPWLRPEVDNLGRDTLQELRLRQGQPPELVTSKGSLWLQREICSDDLHYVVNTASRYSPWAAQSIRDGYLTAPGGHRIGICGQAVVNGGVLTGIRTPESLCIRVARDFPGIGREVPVSDSLLIIGAPGWGKTTLLRDIARNLAEQETVCVVDERGELYPDGFKRGKRMDVLTGCPKACGVERVLRTMGPQWIAVDEITAEEDCEALLHALGCGVKLLATAHAASRQDLKKRPIYRELLQKGVFSEILVLNSGKKWHMERMKECL